MNEYKVRAYDKERKKMVYFGKLDISMYTFYKESNNEFSKSKFRIESSKSYEDLTERNCIGFSEIMQFTGVKDKNGNDIYAGDIVKFEDWKNKEVVWGEDNPECRCCGFMLKDTILFLNTQDAEKMEIIGNIYENPELAGNLE